MRQELLRQDHLHQILSLLLVEVDQLVLVSFRQKQQVEVLVIAQVPLQQMLEEVVAQVVELPCQP